MHCSELNIMTVDMALLKVLCIPCNSMCQGAHLHAVYCIASASNFTCHIYS